MGSNLNDLKLNKMKQRKQLEELILMHCCNNPNKEIDRMAHIKIDELMDDLLSKFKLLPIHDVIERLPIGTSVKIVDKPEWEDEAGTVKTITGHCSYCGKDVGYLLDGEGIYLKQDFEVNVL